MGVGLRNSHDQPNLIAMVGNLLDPSIRMTVNKTEQLMKSIG